MPQDQRRLRPRKKKVTVPVVVAFFLGTEGSPPDRIIAENNDYLICEQTDISTATITYFDFINFRFF
jgi:hypothetical protein